MPSDKFTVLTEIATEILVNELKRRAIAKGMTTEELLAEAKDQWNEAEEANDALRQKGHENE